MVYLTESYADKHSVIITLAGTIDSESLPVVEDAYRKNLDSGKEITINLESVSSIDRSGRNFLTEIHNEVQYVGLPPYIQMDIRNG